MTKGDFRFMCKLMEEYIAESRAEERFNLIANSLKRGKTPEHIEDVMGVSMKEIEDCKKQLDFTKISN